MKQQVVFFKGGIPKENSRLFSYYFTFLLDRFQGFLSHLMKKTGTNRKDVLGENLGNDYEYHIVLFPDKHYADYGKWKISFESMKSVIPHEVVFVATSLGGAFITKYLSENYLKRNIKKLILVAPAIYDTPDESLGSFLPNTEKFQQIIDQCEEIIIYHSKDDTIVPFSDSEKYMKLFPNAIFREFHDKGHFNFEKRIQEIEEDIKS